jgi:hypothetical protein
MLVRESGQTINARVLERVEAALVEAMHATEDEPVGRDAVCELLIGALSAAILTDRAGALERAHACSEILLSVVSSECLPN